MKLKLFVSICALSFIPALPTFAEDKPQNNNMTEHHKYFMQDLNLTPEQKTKIEEIHKSNNLKMEGAIKEVKEKMKLFEEVFINEKSLDTDIKNAKEDLTISHKKIEDLHFQTVLEIRKILNFEQRKKFIKRMPGMKVLHKK